MGWRKDFVENKLKVAMDLNDRKCGGSYAEAVIIISSLISAMSAEVWPDNGKGKIDRKRFVEIIVKYSDPNLNASLISIPLLGQCLNPSAQRAGGRILTGNEIDRSEPDALAQFSTKLHNSNVKVRQYSYPNIFYEEVRSYYVHEYKSGAQATSWQMSGVDDQISYSHIMGVNGLTNTFIHFPIPWLSKLAASIAENIDNLPATPLSQPAKWWIEG